MASATAMVMAIAAHATKARLHPVGCGKASPSNGHHIQREGVGGWDTDLDGQRHAMPLAMHVEKILRDRFLEVCVCHTLLDC